MHVTTKVPEPTKRDLDEIIRSLQATWKATITVRRQSKEDVGYREVILILDGEHLARFRRARTASRPPTRSSRRRSTSP
jgi:hypothetical protein